MNQPDFSQEFAILQQVRCQLHIAARLEFEETMSRFPNTDPGTEALIEQLTLRIVNRFLNITEKELASLQNQDERHSSLKALAQLFGVPLQNSEPFPGQ